MIVSFQGVLEDSGVTPGIEQYLDTYRPRNSPAELAIGTFVGRNAKNNG